MILWYVFHSKIDSLNLHLINSPSQMTFLVPTSIVSLPPTSFINSSKGHLKITWSPGLKNICYPSMAVLEQIGFLMILTAGTPFFLIISFVALRLIICSNNRIAAAPPFSGLRRFPQGRGFKQWTGDDSKALMKVCIYKFIFRKTATDQWLGISSCY